jgi:hypothetical protein
MLQGSTDPTANTNSFTLPNNNNPSNTNPTTTNPNNTPINTNPGSMTNPTNNSPNNNNNNYPWMYPVPYEVPSNSPMNLNQRPPKSYEPNSERQVKLPLMKPIELPQARPPPRRSPPRVQPVMIEQVPIIIEEPIIEKIVEVVEAPPQPVPVIVKTIHDRTVVTEEPTDIHHVELAKKSVVRAAPPPVRATVPQPVEEKSSWPWYYLLPLLCCLPLCCIPLLLCQRTKKYVPGPLAKPNKGPVLKSKELVTREVPEYKVERKKPQKKVMVRRVEEPVEDIEVEIERELQTTKIVEETHVIRKEIPFTEVVRERVPAR